MHRIVDFTQRDEGVAQLTSLRPQVDPGEAEARMWDADLVFAVSEEDADHVSPAVPAARTYLERATGKVASATVKVQLHSRDIRLSVATDKGTAVLDQVAAEVRSLTLRVQPKAQVMVAKLRIFALDRTQSANLLEQQGKPIRVTIDPQQQGLDLQPAAPEVGDLVSARTADDQDVCGVYRGERDGSYLVDDFGVIHRAGSIVSRIKVLDEDGAMADLFRTECGAASKDASWSTLVVALGQALGSGEKVRDATGQFVLTNDVVKRAVVMAPFGAAKPATTRTRKAKS